MFLPVISIYVNEEENHFVYDGNPHPVVFTTNKDLNGVHPDGFTIIYTPMNGVLEEEISEPIRAGEYHVLILYRGDDFQVTSATTKLVIEKATVEDFTIASVNAIFDGLPHQIVVPSNLPAGVKAIHFSDNNSLTDVGTVEVIATIEVDPNYYDVAPKKVLLTVSPKPLTDFVVDEIPVQYFEGEPLMPTVVVHDSTKTLIQDVDYLVTYQDNDQEGQGTIIIEALPNSNYVGTLTVTFEIISSESHQVEIDRKALELEYHQLLSGVVTSLPNLRIVGEKGNSKLTWLSNSTALTVDESGVVSIIQGTKIESVTLIVLIENGNSVSYTSFELIIPALTT